MTTGFEEMTAVELREYAERVQREYDDGQLNGPIGRSIVAHAWERLSDMLMGRSDYNVQVEGRTYIVTAPDAIAAVGHILQKVWPSGWRILYLRGTVCSVEVHSAMGFSTYKVIVVPCK